MEFSYLRNRSVRSTTARSSYQAQNDDCCFSALGIPEMQLKTTHTVDTLEALQEKFPTYRMVWLMGADNLRQFPKWKGWRQIFRMVPIAVFPRPSFSRRALVGKASRRFKRFRIRPTRAPRLANMRPPAWTFLHTQPDTTSATRIRTKMARELRT